MKSLLLSLTLALTACASTPDLVPTDGAIGRQLERVLSRHDSYVIGDPGLEAANATLFLAEADAVRSLAMFGEVRRDALRGAFAPVASRHDAYVSRDATLDDLRRSTYLAATEQIGRLLSPVVR